MTVLPGNRWDLLDGVVPAQPPTVTAVVPHYAAQRQLDLVLAGLAAQTHPASRLQVVVADDGSPTPPRVPPGVTVVRQPDRGFRAAAARNLGAAAADGDVLCFLDGDTVPEPGYVAAASRLPALCPDAVVVGRRRHADLTAVGTAALQAFWADPVELPAPAWLTDAYVRSRDLLDADDRSYRYVISAVLTLPRALFDTVGGFDPTFVGYGGEDWELAHRLWCAGAVLAHEPAAVAWHDGPDWAARTDPRTARAQKNAETLALARRLPDPQLRGPGPWPPYAAVVAELATSGEEAADVLCVRRLLAAGDVRVFTDRAVDGATVGPVPADLAARATVRVHLERPLTVDLAAVLALLTGDVGLVTGPGLRATTSRAAARAVRHGVPLTDLFEERTVSVDDVRAPDLTRDLPG